MTMKQITIDLPTGLEARPVAMLVQVASQYDCSIHIEESNRSVNAKSIMGMMALGLKDGECVTITADGADEKEAVDAIVSYLNRA